MGPIDPPKKSALAGVLGGQKDFNFGQFQRENFPTNSYSWKWWCLIIQWDKFLVSHKVWEAFESSQQIFIAKWFANDFGLNSIHLDKMTHSSQELEVKVPLAEVEEAWFGKHLEIHFLPCGRFKNREPFQPVRPLLVGVVNNHASTNYRCVYQNSKKGAKQITVWSPNFCSISLKLHRFCCIFQRFCLKSWPVFRLHKCLSCEDFFGIGILMQNWKNSWNLQVVAIYTPENSHSCLERDVPFKHGDSWCPCHFSG